MNSLVDQSLYRGPSTAGIARANETLMQAYKAPGEFLSKMVAEEEARKQRMLDNAFKASNLKLQQDTLAANIANQKASQDMALKNYAINKAQEERLTKSTNLSDTASQMAIDTAQRKLLQEEANKQALFSGLFSGLTGSQEETNITKELIPSVPLSVESTSLLENELFDLKDKENTLLTNAVSDAKSMQMANTINSNPNITEAQKSTLLSNLANSREAANADLTATQNRIKEVEGLLSPTPQYKTTETKSTKQSISALDSQVKGLLGQLNKGELDNQLIDLNKDGKIDAKDRGLFADVIATNYNTKKASILETQKEAEKTLTDFEVFKSKESVKNLNDLKLAKLKGEYDLAATLAKEGKNSKMPDDKIAKMFKDMYATMDKQPTDQQLMDAVLAYKNTGVINLGGF